LGGHSWGNIFPSARKPPERPVAVSKWAHVDKSAPYGKEKTQKGIYRVDRDRSLSGVPDEDPGNKRRVDLVGFVYGGVKEEMKLNFCNYVNPPQ